MMSMVNSNITTMYWNGVVVYPLTKTQRENELARASKRSLFDVPIPKYGVCARNCERALCLLDSSPGNGQVIDPANTATSRSIT